MNPIFNALSSGYPANQILNFIQSFIPKLSTKINAAKKQGYSSEKIVEFLSDTMQSEANSSYQTSNRIDAKNREENKQITKDLLKQGVNLGATAIGAKVLSKMVPSIGRMINTRGNTPPQNNPPSPPNSPLTQNPTNNVPIQTQQTPQPPAPNPNPAQPGPNIGQQIGQQAASPVTQAIQPNQNVPIPPAINKSPIPEGMAKKIQELRDSGNDVEQISAYFKNFNPNQTSKFEKQSGKKIEETIQEHLSSIPEKPPIQPQQKPEQPQQSQNIQPLNQNVKENPIQAQEQQNIQPVNQELDIPEESIERNEVGSSVLLPDGSIGEIESVKQGIAKVKVDGKDRHKKVDELIEAPEGLEDAARHLVSLIPEKEKSTAFQESIHITLPGMDGEEMPIMLTKYYGGKWAWYLGVSNDDYNEIALGTYEPKTKKKTSIGEYKPGVIDSRGAGNQELIIKNPKYSKKNKGITWGYAETKYDLFKSIENTLKKMSKEELDEEGNIIKKRKNTS